MTGEMMRHQQGGRMNIIDTDSKVDMLFQLKWRSNNATHTDCYHAIQANIWRDIFPAALSERLIGAQAGDNIILEFTEGQVIPIFPW